VAIRHQGFHYFEYRITVFALRVVISRVRAHRLAVEWSSAPLRYTTSPLEEPVKLTDDVCLETVQAHLFLRICRGRTADMLV
jgi:hypothetical protein